MPWEGHRALELGPRAALGEGGAGAGSRAQGPLCSHRAAPWPQVCRVPCGARLQGLALCPPGGCAGCGGRPWDGALALPPPGLPCPPEPHFCAGRALSTSLPPRGLGRDRSDGEPLPPAQTHSAACTPA